MHTLLYIAHHVRQNSVYSLWSFVYHPPSNSARSTKRHVWSSYMSEVQNSIIVDWFFVYYFGLSEKVMYFFLRIFQGGGVVRGYPIGWKTKQKIAVASWNRRSTQIKKTDNNSASRQQKSHNLRYHTAVPTVRIFVWCCCLLFCWCFVSLLQSH